MSRLFTSTLFAIIASSYIVEATEDFPLGSGFLQIRRQGYAGDKALCVFSLPGIYVAETHCTSN